MMTLLSAGALIGVVVGVVVCVILYKVRLNARSRSILDEARAEAETIKRDKMLEVKEKFISMKAELEKQMAVRSSKVQSAEAKARQKEMQLNQQQQELQRKKTEVEAIRTNLTSQVEVVEKKKAELERLHKAEIEKLEHISGLSAEEAKDRLVESLKEEAKTQAASYINDIMDEARMTANKEAKSIVIKTITARCHRDGHRKLRYRVPHRLRRDKRPHHRT